MISVIVCTRNPRPEYLRRVFRALSAQTLPMDQWELVVVDNNSDGSVAAEWDLSWHPHGRHVREDSLGLTSARIKGIREARGDPLIFVDDDNVLAADYLDRARRLLSEHANLAVVGAGRLEPEFEVPPPTELVPMLPMLAVRTVTAEVWSAAPKDCACLPVGAGLCVTRAVAEAYGRLVARLGVGDVVGRRGRRLFSGDDDLFSWVAANAGQRFGVSLDLRVTHLIVAERVTHDFFLRLIHDHAFSHALLRYLLVGRKPREIDPGDLLRIAAHGARNGAFSMRCRWAERRGEGAAARLLTDRHLIPLPEFAA